jgi:hypothetical protein
VFPEDIDDVVELTRGKRLELNEKSELQVLDKDGDPSSITPEKFFKEVYKKEKPRFYKAPDASGGGAGQGKGGGGGGGTGEPTDKPLAQWTSEERQAYIEKHGPEAMAKLREAEVIRAMQPKKSGA